MFSCNVEDNLKRSEVGVEGSELVALGIMGFREGVREWQARDSKASPLPSFFPSLKLPQSSLPPTHSPTRSGGLDFQNP